MASLIVKTGARRMFPAPLLLLAALYSCVNLWNTAHAQFPVHFSCPQLPPLTKPAQNVYELRPQDIKVVMAMGDSITAGFGMMGRHGDLLQDLLEYRGQSWCIGGDSNASTIASFLRFYTPDIQGASLGTHLASLCYGLFCPPFQYEPSKDVFDAAQSGAMIPNLVDHEFDYLYREVRDNHKVDIDKDWKLLNILVGFNDLCLACSGDIPFLTPDDYEKHLVEVLEEVRKKLPRTFVNLIPLFNISQVYEISLRSKHCQEVHHIFPIECICAFAPGEEGVKLRLELDERVIQYNQRIFKVGKDYAGKYDDFAAIVQPCAMDARNEDLPISVISMLDCFHPSLLMHELMAKVMWNCMLTPAMQKDRTFNARADFICPTNSTLLYTY